MLMTYMRSLFDDELGAVISSELALVGTMGVMSMAVGLEAVASSVTEELKGFANAVHTMTQPQRVNPSSRSGQAHAGGGETHWTSSEPGVEVGAMDAVTVF